MRRRSDGAPPHGSAAIAPPQPQPHTLSTSATATRTSRSWLVKQRRRRAASAGGAASAAAIPVTAGEESPPPPQAPPPAAPPPPALAGQERLAQQPNGREQEVCRDDGRSCCGGLCRCCATPTNAQVAEPATTLLPHAGSRRSRPLQPPTAATPRKATRPATTRRPATARFLEVLVAIFLAGCSTALLLQPVAAAYGPPPAYAPPPPSAGRALYGHTDDGLYGGLSALYGGGGEAVVGGDGGLYQDLLLQQAAALAADVGGVGVNQLTRSQNYKISPKPCSIGRVEGTCMFVWECIKSEGRHVGMCVDSFMFGSCCAHNYTDNIIPLPAHTFSYTRPTKPVGMASLNHRPRPPAVPHRPSGMTTIERPHGAGTLVIRPSGPHHQGPLHRPVGGGGGISPSAAPPWHTKRPTSRPGMPSRPSTSTSSTTRRTTTTTTTTTTARSTSPAWSSSTTTTRTTNAPTAWLSTANFVLGDDQQTAASIAHPQQHTNSWQTSPHTASTAALSSSSSSSTGGDSHWHMPTEPNFITKPRPPGWEKPPPLRPHKPSSSSSSSSSSKPTKRPGIYTPPPQRPAIAPLQPERPLTWPATTTHRPTTAVAAVSHTPPSTSSLGTSPATQRPTRTPAATTTTTTTTTTKTTTTAATTAMGSHQHSRPTPQRPSPAWSGAPPVRPSTALPTKTPTMHGSAATATATQEPLTTRTTPKMRPTAMAPATAQRPTTTAAAHSDAAIIETNEIAGSSGGSGAGSAAVGGVNMPTIKTISAARSECGMPVLARAETRIVGGKSAPFGRWPWQVSVRRTSFFGFSSTHRCGGALINENWIATAGHCVDDLLISQIRIRVGEYDFSHVQEQLPYIERGVTKKVVHPKYNFFTYEYDLALVKLEQPLEFAPHVSPICLPETDSLLIGMNATVTGWGRLSEGGTLPSVLQEVTVPIVSNDNCKTMFLRAGRQEIIPDIFLCAGYETGGQDSCQGDSGGPLQVKSQDGRYFLAGIISWGIGCAEANLPGVCTRISKFVPWIVENVT